MSLDVSLCFCLPAVVYWACTLTHSDEAESESIWLPCSHTHVALGSRIRSLTLIRIHSHSHKHTHSHTHLLARASSRGK
ncbi:hypothetical protein GQ42DRAFT_41676 [Ramicandelaber brevisporus]|nr:hypothetical protein GQ42DRAFT_41676 [Ramicandelaber brevisporus]